VVFGKYFYCGPYFSPVPTGDNGFRNGLSVSLLPAPPVKNQSTHSTARISISPSKSLIAIIIFDV